MSVSRRILIVEDEPHIKLVFRAALCSNDSSVVTAEDGETALRWLLPAPFDVIPLDLRLPGISGIEVLHRLR